MTSEIRVGQVRAQGPGGGKVAPDSIRVMARNEGRDDWKVVKQSGVVVRMSAASILKRYHVVVMDAPPEAKSDNQMHEHVWLPTESGGHVCKTCPATSVLVRTSMGATAPSAPSPLEVVRSGIRHGERCACDVAECDCGAALALIALATLEESARADEREQCAKVVDGRSTHHAEMQRRMESDVMRRAQGAASDACADAAEFIRRRKG